MTLAGEPGSTRRGTRQHSTEGRGVGGVAGAGGVAGVAGVAKLLGEESRAAMCLAMMDGRPWTLGELAREAGVGKACASEHITKLAAAGLVVAQTQGRCRYVRITPELARVLEPLSALTQELPAGSLNEVRGRRHLALARTCYDHLAGRLGVAVLDALTGQRLLRRSGGLSVTRRGRAWFADLDVDVAALERQPRTVVRDCLDLTAQRPHLAGHLGAALCTTMLEREWVRRPDRTRALEVTPRGERALGDLLGITPADLGRSLP